MDADIAYEPRLFELLRDAPVGRSKTLVCGDHRDTNEEVLVFRDMGAGLPRIHGKGLIGTGLVRNEDCVGEATGILLWEASDHELLAAATDWCIRYSTAKTRSEHEDITQRMMLAGRVEAVSFGADLLFMECDTPEEYEVLTREMYPRIAAKVI
jgi:choline kinase